MCFLWVIFSPLLAKYIYEQHSKKLIFFFIHKTRLKMLCCQSVLVNIFPISNHKGFILFFVVTLLCNVICHSGVCLVVSMLIKSFETQNMTIFLAKYSYQIPSELSQKKTEHNLEMSNIFLMGIPKNRQLYFYFLHSFVFALNLVHVIMLIAFALELLSVILDWKCKWNELMKIFYIWTY